MLAQHKAKPICQCLPTIILSLMTLTLQGAPQAEIKGYSTIHLRILSAAGLVVRPVVIVLQNEEAGLRIEVSQSEAPATERLVIEKPIERLDEVILKSIPYGKYKLIVKSPLLLQLETNLEINVAVPVFSRSIFMAENLPMIKWDAGDVSPPLLTVENNSVPEAFAWIQLRYLHRFFYLIEGRLDEKGSIAVPKLSDGEYVAIIFPRRGSPWSVVVRYQDQYPAVLKVVR